jgi:HSP20 family protein
MNNQLRRNDTVITRWSPFTRTALPSFFEGWSVLASPAFGTPLDVQKTDGGYRIQAALPGFKPEDVEITLENGTLTIGAKRSDDKQAEQGRYLHREVVSGSFVRRLALPAEVTADDVTASFENGLLTLDVRYETAKPVRIPIGAAAQAELPESTSKQ